MKNLVLFIVGCIFCGVAGFLYKQGNVIWGVLFGVGLIMTIRGFQRLF